MKRSKVHNIILLNIILLFIINTFSVFMTSSRISKKIINTDNQDTIKSQFLIFPTKFKIPYYMTKITSLRLRHMETIKQVPKLRKYTTYNHFKLYCTYRQVYAFLYHTRSAHKHSFIPNAMTNVVMPIGNILKYFYVSTIQIGIIYHAIS